MYAAEDLEHPNCPLCGTPADGEVVRRLPPFAVRRCRRCRLLFLAPRLDEAVMGADYRDGAYFEGAGTGYRSYAAQEVTLRRTFRQVLGEMRHRGLTGGRLLEVGCGYGYFLDEARGLFSHRTGTDFSSVALAQAHGRAERLVAGGLAELPGEEPFDCAALIHVIEHVYQPVPFLRDLRSRLRPGGWLVVATPHAGALWRPLMGSRWPFYKAPEHVTFFTRPTLERLLATCGFVEISPLPYASIFSLDLVAEKLSLPVPPFLARVRIHLPGATLALCARNPGPGADPAPQSVE